MIGLTAIGLSMLIFLSMWCCFWAGQRSMWLRMRDLQEKRRRWAEWEDFDNE